MPDPIQLLDGLSDEEVQFLIRVWDKNLLACMPLEYPALIGLIYQGFLEAMPDDDPSHETLIVTEKGRSVVDLILAERECPPT